MDFTVDQVFTEARDCHPAFIEQQTPPKPLLRFLDRQRDSLLQDTVAAYPDAVLTCTEEVELPFEDYEAGEPLPEHYFARGAWVYTKDGRSKRRFRLIPWNNLATTPASRWPCGAIKTCRLYLAGSPGLWNGFARITLDYVPIPTPLSEAKKPIEEDFAPLPGFAKNALVTAAAWWMATRDPELEDRPFRDDYLAERDRYLITLTSQRRAAPVMIHEGG